MRGPFVLALVLAAAAPTPAALARFAPVRLGDRITKSRAVAVGRIEGLDEEFYDLAVEQVLGGIRLPASIRVRRFQDWTCAERPWPYVKGQRLLVFLEKDRGEWDSMGAGCEGEVLLADGKATVRFPPRGPLHGVYAEVEFLSAVADYRALHRKPGDPGWIEAWHRLLSSASPIVVGAAVEEMRTAGVTGKEPTSVAGALWALLESGPPEIRAAVARNPHWTFGSEILPALLPRLRRPAPAFRLARASLEPTGRNVANLIDSLADPAHPVEVRRALAAEMAIYTWRPQFKAPLADVATAAASFLRLEKDPDLQRRFLQWLADLYGGDEPPWARDPAPFRERWLPRLDAAARETAVLPEPEDPYLSAAEGVVEVPASVPIHERAAVAWVVRAVRRGRSAEKAGDAAAARLEFRMALAEAFGGVEEAARGLGADLAALR